MADILVVDDDDNMRSLMKTILERRGHRVSEAHDGLEALARFEEKQPELVITDIVMPGVGGITLLNELRRRASPPKVLLVSGRSNPPEADWAIPASQGLVGFIPKPFTPAELMRAVEALLGLQEEARAS